MRKMQVLFCALFCLVNSEVMASQYQFTLESELAQKYQDVILPFWDAHVQIAQFQGVGDIPIQVYYLTHPQSQGSIVLSSGRSESALKYKEVFYDLYQNGYSVFSIDHRGQGLSGRMVGNADKGHVHDYQHYVDDFAVFVNQFVLPKTQTKPYFLCHSMGCTIGALYLAQQPTVFAKAAFTAPFFGINSPIPDWIGKLTVGITGALNKAVTKQPWYFLGQGDHRKQAFSDNVVTQSEIRYNIAEHEFNEAAIQLGGVTVRWLQATLAAFTQLEQVTPAITTPTLLLQAGADVVVDNEAQNRLCAKIPNCRLDTIPGAFHELMMEQDQYRIPTLTKVLDFFEQK